MDQIDGPATLVGIDLGPLIKRIVETADIGTVVLVLILIVLVGLLISERSRNNALTKNYMAQSVELVAVLSSVRELMNTVVRYMQVNENATGALVGKVGELNVLVNLTLDRLRPPTRRRRAPEPPPEQPANTADDKDNEGKPS